MKTETHPEYVECRVVCSCGNNFTTRATVPELHVELCAECHPFYTGKQKLVDTGGRVERFQRRYAEAEKAGAPKKKADDEEEAAPTRRAPAKDSRRRKAPVAAKAPRPKFEARPGRGEGRGEGRGDGRGEGRGGRDKGGRGGEPAKSAADEAPAEGETPASEAE